MRSLCGLMALVFLLFAASGFAAEINCSPVNSWTITDQNVTCQNRNLTITGTITINGRSNVSFVGVGNISAVAVYNNSNFTASNVSFSTSVYVYDITTYGDAFVKVLNQSFLGPVSYFSDNSTVYVENSTIRSPCGWHGTYFLGYSVTLANVSTQDSGVCKKAVFGARQVSLVDKTNFTVGGGYNTVTINATRFDINDSTVSVVTVYLEDGYDSAIFVQNGSQVTMINSTFSGLAFKGTKNVSIFNVTPTNYEHRPSNVKSSDGSNITTADSNISIFFLISGEDSEINISNSTIYADSSVYSSFFGNVTLKDSQIGLCSQCVINFYGPKTVMYNLSRVFQYAGGGLRVLFNGTRVYLYNSNISAQGHYVWFSDNVIAELYNTTIVTQGSQYATVFQNNSRVNATNTTFNAVSFSETGTLYMKNYFKLFVNDSAGRALRNVSVVAYNTTSGETDFVGSTDAYGYLNTSLLWYKQNATQAYNVSLTVNVTAGDAVNQSEYNMSVDRAYNATMGGRFNYVTGSPLVGGFTNNVSVFYGNESLRPWNGTRQVELRSGVATVVANFSWNFSAGDLNLSNITITRSDTDRYVGINGTNVTALVTTVWVPVWGKECNVRVCAGKANYSHCAAGDWAVASSVQSGEYCVLAVNGTVVQDRPTAVTTKMVIKVPGWDVPLVVALFAFAFAVFVLRRRS